MVPTEEKGEGKKKVGGIKTNRVRCHFRICTKGEPHITTGWETTGGGKEQGCYVASLCLQSKLELVP